MPRVALAKMKHVGAYQARFVAPDYDPPDRVFCVSMLPKADQDRVANQLAREAEICRIAHGEKCTCIAQQATRTDERTLLVLHDVR